MSKDYFKITHCYDENGAVLVCDKYIQIHETPCFSFCLYERDYNRLINIKSLHEERLIDKAKRIGTFRIKRIHKINSRFAFDTKQKAFDNFLYLKELQIGHMERNIAILTPLLSELKGKEFEKLNAYDSTDPIASQWKLVGELSEIINEHYNFN
jgi:hypothetical protein